MTNSASSFLITRAGAAGAQLPNKLNATGRVGVTNSASSFRATRAGAAGAQLPNKLNATGRVGVAKEASFPVASSSHIKLNATVRGGVSKAVSCLHMRAGAEGMAVRIIRGGLTRRLDMLNGGRRVGCRMYFCVDVQSRGVYEI